MKTLAEIKHFVHLVMQPKGTPSKFLGPSGSKQHVSLQLYREDYSLHFHTWVYPHISDIFEYNRKNSDLTKPTNGKYIRNFAEFSHPLPKLRIEKLILSIFTLRCIPYLGYF